MSLIRYVDFVYMRENEARTLLREIPLMDDRKAVALAEKFWASTNGICTEPWITRVAAALMMRVGLRTTVRRLELIEGKHAS